MSPFQVKDVSSENNAIYYEDKSTSNLYYRVWNLFVCGKRLCTVMRTQLLLPLLFAVYAVLCVLSIECIYEDQGPAPKNPFHLLDHRTNKRVLLVSQLSAHTSKAPLCVLRQTKPGTASAWMAASPGTANHSSGHTEISAFFHCSPKTPEAVFPVIF